MTLLSGVPLDIRKRMTLGAAAISLAVPASSTLSQTPLPESELKSVALPPTFMNALTGLYVPPPEKTPGEEERIEMQPQATKLIRFALVVPQPAKGTSAPVQDASVKEVPAPKPPDRMLTVGVKVPADASAPFDINPRGKGCWLADGVALRLRIVLEDSKQIHEARKHQDKSTISELESAADGSKRFSTTRLAQGSQEAGSLSGSASEYRLHHLGSIGDKPVTLVVEFWKTLKDLPDAFDPHNPSKDRGQKQRHEAAQVLDLLKETAGKVSLAEPEPAKVN